jgi:fatty acid desaturase
METDRHLNRSANTGPSGQPSRLSATNQVRRRQIEVPTLLLAAVIYGSWVALTWWHRTLPDWLLACAGAWIIAWHGSLQHETIHGHPTRIGRINALIGGVPLSLWLPYCAYRRSHIAHHRSIAITDPYDDPESRYLTAPAGWWGRSKVAIERVQSTLFGRLLLGPFLTVGRFLSGEVARGWRSPRETASDWIPHLAGVALVVAWLAICRISVAHYLLLFVYPGISLTLLRSFAEHRASRKPGHRVAIVERAGVFGLLFLNNNLHAAHHRAPGLAWYVLPDFHRRYRQQLLRANGGLLYRGYYDIVRRFAFRPHDTIVHPDHRPAMAEIIS